jgi:ParB family chromosome partitioning protein
VAPPPLPIGGEPSEAGGAASGREIVDVLLDDVDLADKRFQCRLEGDDPADLLESLRVHGQRLPVLLWGARPPYKIVDGFRRTAALAALGAETVRAVMVSELDEPAAFALGFVSNFRRRSLAPMDRASAIWRAIHYYKKPRFEVARIFGLSERQIHRYLKLLDLDPSLRTVVVRGEITMAHAVLIHQNDAARARHLVTQVVDQGLSVKDLRHSLQQKRRGRPRLYVVREGPGFRVRSFRYSPKMAEGERRRIVEALEWALAQMQSGSVESEAA